MVRKNWYRVQAETIMKNFDKRGYEGYYCETSAEAVEKVMEIIKSDSVVSFGGTVTMYECGLKDALDNRKDITLLDRYKCKTPEESKDIYHKSFNADYYIMSTNAITMDGLLVNTDGAGNRLAALIYGPENVIIVAGMNKVAADLEAAKKRVKSQATPPNCIRLERKTPCALTGECHECFSDDCICSHSVVTRRSPVKGRIKIMLVGEVLGY